MFRTRGRLFSGLVLVLLTASACARSKRLDRDDVRSALVSAQSYAAETLLFIDYVRQRRATRDFARTHAMQLAIDITRSYQELDQASPEAGTENAFQTCKRELAILSHEIRAIPNLMDNNAALDDERAKISAVKSTLASAGSDL